MKYILPIVLGIFLCLLGCKASTTDGGESTVEYTSTVTTVDPQTEKPVVETKTVKVNVEQPESPQNPGQIKVTVPQQGDVKIESSTGSAQNNAKTFAAIGLLDNVVYVGIALIVAGLVAALLLKNLYWGIALGIVGGIMIAGPYLLVQYSGYFMVGLVALVCYLGYLAYDYFRSKRANKENIELIQEAKKEGVIDAEKFAKMANLAQSESTQKIVKKTKKELKKR